jgi:hypothetical protein
MDIILPPLNYQESDLKSLSPDLFSYYLGIILHENVIANKATISDTIQDDFLEIDFETLGFRIPNKIYDAIHNNKKDISVLPITLNYPYPITNSHANVLIINPTMHTIEFFEPQGISFLNSPNNILDTTRVILSIFFKIFPEFKSYVIINSSQSCVLGIQTLQNTVDNSAGHCLAWTLLFIQLRLSYINKPSDFIVSSLAKRDPKVLDSYIKRYITFLNNNYNKISIKDFNTFKMDGFRELLSTNELELEKDYLEDLITKYFLTLSIKNKIIRNDKSPNTCYQCKHMNIKYNHQFSVCCFNQRMLDLNNKINKLYNSVNGYKNTPHFHQIYFQTTKLYFSL